MPDMVKPAQSNPIEAIEMRRSSTRRMRDQM